VFRLINLGTLNLLAYSYKESKSFASLISRHLHTWPIPLGTLGLSPY